jgi:hypothetical protein
VNHDFLNISYPLSFIVPSFRSLNDCEQIDRHRVPCLIYTTFVTVRYWSEDLNANPWIHSAPRVTAQGVARNRGMRTW